MKNLGNAFIIGAFIVILGGFMVLYTSTLTNRKVGINNTAYVRVLNCIIARNATQRTQSDIEHCYTVIEQEFHTTLTRYDKL